MTSQLKTVINDKTTISIGIITLLAPFLFMAGNAWADVQATTRQNTEAIVDVRQQQAEILKEMRLLQESLNATNINVTKLNTQLEQQK